MRTHGRAALTVLLVAGISLVSFNSASAITAPKFGLVPTEFSQHALLDLRGGASKKRKRKARTGSLSKTVTGKTKVGAKKAAEKKSSSKEGLAKWYAEIPRLTKIYVNCILICTTLGLMLGEERAQAVLALDPMRLMYGFELWRPFTAASFLGSPSISWLMSGYYLYEYGSSLEKAYGPAEYLVFLATQIALLTMFSAILGIPFFTQSVITGMLHVLSRAMPHQKVKWLVITVPYWTLPYGLMASDVLQSKSAAAAMPHILGILVGHFYQFNRFIWPKTGGEDWLRAPDFLVNKLDPNSLDNSAAKESIKKALKKQKKSGGRKLGTA
eukprot:CAMPEP_0116151436 /NCGR_PEP_ID=MMETSP0329-20121206/20093_1 /TAXON_ID=697910 /ORGANISM="Pseudo-nitzschia arenysensis, Strain B593" /LENGTH=326 /DNA_ID=CAMNT_0003648043 /DNA_START=213 /DNA_END=1193 /DNA_ORIENTATION=+